MQRSLLIFAAVLAFSVALKIDLEREYEKAEAELSDHVKQQMISGATSSRFLRRKENRVTRKIAHRNRMFRALHKNLLAVGLEKEEAKHMANEAMRQGRRKPGSAGGQGGSTRPVTIIEDSCDDTATLECDSSYKYRNIEGTCNNLDNAYEGSAGTAFTRYAVVADNMDPIKNITTYDLPVGSSRQRKGGKGGNGGSSGGGSPPSGEACGAGSDSEEEDRSRKGKRGKGGHHFEPRQGKGGKGGKGSKGGHHGGGHHHPGGNTCSGTKDGCMVRPNLPGARLVSVTVHKAADVPSTKATHFTTQFGQFLDHDITLTPEEHVEGCCGDNTADPECLTINVAKDAYFSNTGTTCLEFTRSVSHCEGVTSERREQTNGITSFVDGSNIYGSDQVTADLLRTNIGGEMKVTSRDSGDLLPKIEDFYTAGDVRAREMPGLSVSHTIWLREHNRIAKLLQATLTDDEEIYQAARRIVVAEWQNVVYGQYMTEVLGEDSLKPNEDGSDYKWSTDPQMTNEFATAAFRYGHSMIQPTITMLAVDDATTEVGSYNLRDVFFEDGFYENNFDNILMGLINLPAQTNDANVGEDLTNHLFANVGLTTDLVARNLQRGRDHGLPGFCCYYKKMADDDFDCTQGWDRRYDNIPSDIWAKMQEVYDCPSDIDLFTGGIAQLPSDNSHLGKVFKEMIKDQFARTKEGDRFFFTHRGSNLNGVGFQSDARKILVSRTMSAIICDNSNITKVPQNVFTLGSATVDCSGTAKIDESNVAELLKFAN